MPGWRCICDFARDVRELVRGDWLFMWFLAPVTVILLALILWVSWLSNTVQVITGDQRWRKLTDTPQGLAILAGFVALTLGHMINAWLTRRRDDRLREEGARALGSLLAAELEAVWFVLEQFRATCLMHRAYIRSDHFPSQLSEATAVWLPEFKALNANMTRMGILGAELEGEVMRITAIIRGHVQIMLNYSYKQLPAVAPPPKAVDGLEDWTKKLAQLINELRTRAELPSQTLTSNDIARAEKYIADLEQSESSDADVATDAESENQ